MENEKKIENSKNCRKIVLQIEGKHVSTEKYIL